MTLEEAMAISERRLPGEPPEPDWRASRPAPEPRRKTPGLDTAPAPEVDVAYVIRAALKAERSIMSEIVGGAIGEIRADMYDEIERMIAQAIENLRAETRVEAARALHFLRCEIFAQIDCIQKNSGELRTKVDEILAKRRRARSKPNGNGSALLLPAPNGNGHAQ
jgi:hypothetical protein